MPEQRLYRFYTVNTIIDLFKADMVAWKAFNSDAPSGCIHHFLLTRHLKNILQYLKTTMQLSIKISTARDKNISEKCSTVFCNCTENFSESERGISSPIPIER